MAWAQHVSEISSKAATTLGFLRRNLAFVPRSTKEVAYKTLVWPKLEYAAPIWSRHSKHQINQIGKVQRTAALWTCRSVCEILNGLEWPSLEALRKIFYSCIVTYYMEREFLQSYQYSPSLHDHLTNQKNKVQ